VKRTAFWFRANSVQEARDLATDIAECISAAGLPVRRGVGYSRYKNVYMERQYNGVWFIMPNARRPYHLDKVPTRLQFIKQLKELVQEQTEQDSVGGIAISATVRPLILNT